MRQGVVLVSFVSLLVMGIGCHANLEGAGSEREAGEAGGPADPATRRDAGAGADGLPASAGEDALAPWQALIGLDRLHQIRVTIARSDVVTLETRHGPDIPSEIIFDDMIVPSVGIHQKGSAYHGCKCLSLPCTNPSCTTRDEVKVKPSLKLSFDAFIRSQRLFGLKNLVLNSARQDWSFVAEHTVYEVYRRAGFPAPQTAYAQLVVNGIPQGLYVVEEAVDGQFLLRNFGAAGGNLYSGTIVDLVTNPDGPGVGSYEDAELSLQDEVTDGRTRDDLFDLSGVVLGVPDDQFEAEVSKLFNLDAFLTQWAIDAVINWRDDYPLHLNNYILYKNPTDGRLIFLPHSPDAAMLQATYPTSLSPYPSVRGPLGDHDEEAIGMLAQAARDIPSLYARYKREVARVGRPPIWDTQALLARIARAASLLATAKPDARSDADLARSKMYRPEIEAFIRAYGTSRNPEQTPPGTPSIGSPEANAVPVIFSSDLSYPAVPANADDFFDVAVLASMPDVDLKGIVLDNALSGKDLAQIARPGAIALSQLETLLRRRTRAFVGLGRAMKSIDDQVLDDKERFQGGVRFILDTLEKAGRPVSIVTVGSLRDVAAAFNRQSALFRQKVGKVLVFGGEAASTPAGLASARDYNVGLDHYAFAAVMKSGLPIYWVPREDGGVGPDHPSNAGHSSAWTAPLADVLAPLSGSPRNYFVNALGMPAFYAVRALICCLIGSPEDVLAQSRDLWGAAALLAIADKTVVYDGARVSSDVGLLSPPAGAVFGFSGVDVTVSDTGYVTSYGRGPDSRRINRFDRLADQGSYARAMTLMTGKMLARLMP